MQQWLQILLFGTTLLVAFLFCAVFAASAANDIFRDKSMSPALRVIGAVVAAAILIVPIPFAVYLRVVDNVRSRQFRARKRRGVCVHCGYDISGASSKCPECGGWTVRDHSSFEGLGPAPQLPEQNEQE
jgi:hypothetical protein